jgi:hypothetical protein
MLNVSSYASAKTLKIDEKYNEKKSYHQQQATSNKTTSNQT